MVTHGEVVVAFLDDGANAPVEVRTSEGLATAIYRAVQASELASASDSPGVSFTTLFIGLVAGNDPVGDWLRAQFRVAGDLAGLLVRPGLDSGGFEKLREQPAAPTSEPLQRTQSARAALEEGARLARDRGDGTLDTRHVVAAYLALPSYHDEDFRVMRIDRVAWGRAFAEAMARRHPVEGWPRWFESVFPAAAAPPAPQVSTPAPTAPIDLGHGGAGRPVVIALTEASVLAGDGPILPSHVLRAIVSLAAGRSDSDAFPRFARLVPLEVHAPSGSTAVPDASRIDPAFLRQLRRAQQPSPGTTALTEIWGRDLVTAALLASDEPAAILAEAERTLPEIRDAWFGFVTATDVHRSLDEWHAWWDEAGVPLPPEQRSGLALETAAGTDQLGIEDEAAAFARLILDRKVHAPLSIGLLGDWGSGKSFFIGQLRAQIASIRSRPRPELYSSPIEIEFNAWHASDANLWASLVTHIFDAIWEQVAPSAGADVETARQELLARIQAAQGAVHEAEAKVEAGQQAVVTAERKLEEARSRLGWNQHVQAVSRRQLHQLAQRAGWEKPLDTINDVRAAVRELAASGGRLRAAANALLDRPIRNIAVPTIVLATFTAALWILLRNESVAAQLVRWSGSAAAAVGTVVAPLRLGGSKLAALAGTLEKIRDEYDATVEQLSAKERAALVERERSLAAAEEQLALAKQHLEELIAEHAALDPRRRLGAFLQERVQSTIYRSQQGIISLVRKDFERLSELMRNLREPARKVVDEAERKVLEADRKAQIRPFDRIILYVDDLDRCRPAHVVHMLEAVHLLLALDLFIVVVAVDSRWLTRALEVHYKDLLAVHGVDDDVRVSTPHNYLEKIFHITYALGPMDPGHFGNYVRSLAGEASATTDGHGAKPPPDVPGDGAKPGGEDKEKEKEKAKGPKGTDANSATAGQQEQSSGSSGASVAGQKAETDATDGHARDSVAEAPTVRIDAAEQELIVALIPLLPTPRLAKRLVNVYRLIKSSLNAGQREQFELDGRPASCLLVLAILFGRPALAGELLRALQEKSAPFDDDQGSLVDAVKARTAAAGEPAPLTAEWTRLAATLEAMEVDATVGACAREPLTVARYSLVTGHDWHTWCRA